MSNLTSSSASISIDMAKAGLLSSIGTFYVIFGTIGNLLNILLFTRHTIWRQSPCIPYLLASSVFNLFIVYTTILLRTLIGFQITPTYNSRITCKLLIYISNVSLTSSTWCTVGSCWDRYVSSSSNATTRCISNRRTTGRVIFAIIFAALIIYIQTLVCYETGATWTSVPCSSKDTFCSRLEVATVLLIQFITPFVLLMYFGIGTFLNIRRSVRQRRGNVNAVVPNEATRASVRNDQLILRVVFAQVIIFLVCVIPICAFAIYQVIPDTFIKTNVRLSVENLVFNLSLLLYTFDKVGSFYTSTLSSAHFRKELKQLMCSIYHRGRVMPHV